MDHDISIRYEAIKLSPMTEEESEWYRQMRNLDENRKWFKSKEIVSSEEQRRWYRKYLEQNDTFMFSVYTIEGEFIGGVSVYHINGDKQEAEFGRLLLNSGKAGRRGLGKVVVRAVSEIAREHLQLKKLYLDVYTDNIAAYKTYLGTGFVITGKGYDDRHREMYLMEKEL